MPRRLDDLWLQTTPILISRLAGPMFRLPHNIQKLWQGSTLAGWEVSIYVTIILLAAIARFWALGDRAIHHDESLHAFYSWNLYQGLGFQHNPMMHGPFQFEATAFIFFLFGDNDYTARLLYAASGTILVGLAILMRHQVGRFGALVLATMLAFSPSMLYFSRFARNDILIATLTFGLMVCMWRYLEEGKTRYMYISACLLAVIFATKETSYLITVTFALYLAMVVCIKTWTRISVGIQIAGSTVSSLVTTILARLWHTFHQGIDLTGASRHSAYFILLVTLTLPQWSAFTGIFQNTVLLNWSNLILVAPEGSGPIGSALGGGMLLATLIVVALLGISSLLGVKWHWRIWLSCAAIFYTVWILLYTTFLTNLNGIGSGIWQSAGYWIVQQGVGRGGQPWYYYIIISSIYEYLPLTIGIIATFYYLRKKDSFGLFLVFWAFASLLFYTIASEKMPWLLVNITLPFIVLTAKFLGELIEAVPWRSVFHNSRIIALPTAPAILVAMWVMVRMTPADNPLISILIPLLTLILISMLIYLSIYLIGRDGIKSISSIGVIGIALLLVLLSARTGIIASFHNDDTPVEMLVYTQTSPDVPQMRDAIEKYGIEQGIGLAVPVDIDQTNGFTWPWSWYLRNYTNINFPTYSPESVTPRPSAVVTIVHSNNRIPADRVFASAGTSILKVKHRWWYPEAIYRDLTIDQVWSAVLDLQSWHRVMDYLLFRKGVKHRIGSEDSYAYFNEGFLK